ncbi:MAG: ABC transporter substrate-binding protein [Deltaproteobacteria bacterium]|nr:ABC transporter substrate-binding protein [Deltaproteobacteria bacterium]
MNPNLKWYFLILVGLLAGIPRIGIAQPSESAPLRIGYVTDLTGRGAFFGTQSSRGTRLAQSESSALKVIVEDTAGDSSRALSAVTKLIDFDKVDAVICDLTPICTPIVGKVAAAKKPLIYLSPAVSISERYQYAYRNFIDYVEGCHDLARIWKDRGIQNAATLTPNMEFGELCAEGFSRVYENRNAVRYNPGDDLRTPVMVLRSAGIKAVLQVGYEPDFLNWYRLCNSLHYYPTQGFMEVMLSQAVREAMGEAGASADMFGYEDLSSEFIAQLDRVAPLAGGEFNRQGAALAYNAVKMLERAFSQCSNRNDSVCLDSSLRSEPPGTLLMGFRGWKNKNAPYPIKIKRKKAEL